MQIKNKIREIHLLGDYIFCYNKHFDKSNILNKLKFLRGIKHLLIGSINSQKEIKFFIDKCKKSETMMVILQIIFMIYV